MAMSPLSPSNPLFFLCRGEATKPNNKPEVNLTTIQSQTNRAKQKPVSSKSRLAIVRHAVAFEMSVALLQYLLKMLLLNQKFGIYLMSPSFL